MTAQERRTTLLLSSIYAFRMLGLFMILPIMSLYATSLKGATPFLIGLSLGVYGLTQAVLQIPFGMISDRIGRKPVIVFGLILFLLGSVEAALSHTMMGIIWGRALQGAGAIGSTLTAFVADSTEEKNRLKAMSLIGMTIGSSFIIAMVLGPILNGIVGLSGIFWLTAALALMGIGFLCFIPTPKHHDPHPDCEPVSGQFKKVLMNPDLLRLDFGIFAQHAILTALFIAIPLLLVNQMGLTADHQWKVYLPVLLLSFIAMVPFIIAAEKKGKMTLIFRGAIALIALVAFAFWLFPNTLFFISVLLFLFFTAFTFLEAAFPSLISKKAPKANKGTAMGIYSSAQFLGILAGGTLGGFFFHHFGLSGVFLFCASLGGVSLLIALK